MNLPPLNPFADNDEEDMKGGQISKNLQLGLENFGFNTLSKMIANARLLKELVDDTGLTIFAPTDAGIQEFLNSQPEFAEGERNIEKMDEAALQNLLLNHIVHGKIMAVDIQNGMKVRNLAGKFLHIKKNESGVSVEGANVGRVDLPVANIIVHELASVILTENLQGDSDILDLAQDILAEAESDEDKKGGQISKNLQLGLENFGFSTLSKMIANARLLKELVDDTGLTIFAPTDAAIQEFLTSQPEFAEGERNIEKMDEGALQNLLLNHIVHGKIMAADIQDGMKVRNLAGKFLHIKKNESGVSVEDANVGRVDLSVSNIIVHELASVILTEKLQDDSDIVDLAHDILAEAESESDSFTRVGNTLVRYFDQNKTYVEAKSHCLSYNSRLLEIWNKEEWNEVKNPEHSFWSRN